MRFCRLLFPLVFLLGCGQGDGRLEVSGTIKHKSALLDQGTIQFLPKDAGAASMILVPIRDGKYHVPRDKGLLPGNYRVLISAPIPGVKEAPVEAAPGDSRQFQFKERLPAEYNSASTKTVQIEAGKPNVFDYDIP